MTNSLRVDHDHEHGHSHEHHDHQHDGSSHEHGDQGHSRGHGGESHEHHKGFKGWLFELFVPQSHDAADSIDDALEASTQGCPGP